MSDQKRKPSKMNRHRIRRLVVQSLYQSAIQEQDIYETILQFMVEHGLDEKWGDLYKSLLLGVVEHQAEVDKVMQQVLDRDLESLQAVELSILRLSTYELKYRLDIPHKVVINEGVELAKEFGAVDGYKYVNGVLDKLFPLVRDH